MVKELVVIKVPRDDKLEDKPIAFPRLQNLHLDLIEIKRKLKKSLPAIKKESPPKSKSPTPNKEKVVAQKDVKTSNSKNTIKLKGNKGLSKPPSTPKEDNPEEIELDFEPIEPGQTPKKSSRESVDQKEPVRNKFRRKEIDEDEPEDVIETDDVSGEDDEEMMKEFGGDDDEGGDEGEDEDGGDEGGDDDGEGEEEMVDTRSPEEIEAEEKEEYIWRFKILKKKYKDRSIPSFNEHDDLTAMKSTYNREIKEITLENNVSSYKNYLVSGFMAVEWGFTNMLGIDFTGFSADQMSIMDQYDSMLIELGERSYNSWGSSLPIELRLLGFIMFQAGIFYLGKILQTKGGSNINTVIKGMTGRPTTQPQQTTPPQETKKMRGPSIKFSDLKKEQGAQ